MPIVGQAADDFLFFVPVATNHEVYWGSVLENRLFCHLVQALLQPAMLQQKALITHGKQPHLFTRAVDGYAFTPRKP